MASEAILNDNQHKIRLTNSILGKEEVFFNEKLVSSKKVLVGGSIHSWKYDNDEYELVVNIGLNIGKIELLKNKQQVDIIEGRAIDVVSGKRTMPSKGNIWLYALKCISLFVGCATVYSLIMGKNSIFYMEDYSKIIGFITSPIGIGLIVFNVFFIWGCIYATYKSKYF